MLRNIILLFVIASFTWINGNSQLITDPTNIVTLEAHPTDGNNGMAVAYNKEKSLYYTVFGGNSEFAIETYSLIGKKLHSTTAKADMRGMWWNEKKKQLQGNAAGDFGMAVLGLDGSGYAGAGVEFLYTGEKQPDFNSVGGFDNKKQRVHYYFRGTVYSYKIKSGKKIKKELELQLPTGNANINQTTLIHTGRDHYKYGVLDYQNKKVYFFCKKGIHRGTVNLPVDAVTSERFWFSFANNRVWLYNGNNRLWTGYKIF